MDAEKHETSVDIEETQDVLEPLARPWEGQKPANAYSTELRQRAIELALEMKNSAKAAHQLGLPTRRVQAWVVEEIGQAATDWETFEVQKLEEKIDDVLARIGPDKIEAANLRDLAVSLGILVDKRAGLLAKTKAQSNPPTRLRIAWRGQGEGAVEVTGSRE